MGACANGAVKLPGAPSTIRPSDADMQRWFGDLYYKWWGPLTVFMGEVFDVDAIVASNLDMPTPPTEMQVKDSLMGASGQIYDMQESCRKWIEYSIFYENSLCIGAGGACTVNMPYPGQLSQYNPVAVNIYDSGQQERIDSVYYDGWGADENCNAGFHYYIDCYNASGGYLGPVNVGVTYPHNTRQQMTLTPIAGTTRFVMKASSAGANGCWYIFTMVEGHWTGICRAINAPPPAIAMPSFPNIPPYVVQTGCTTDDVCRLVQMTLNKLDALYDPIKATQRTIAPQAYLLGAPINAADDGVAIVGAMVGCIVHVTNVPPGWGREIGADPRRLPALLSVRFGTADGATRAVGVRHEHQLIPNDAPYADRIVYTPRPFVTATITPLLREA